MGSTTTSVATYARGRNFRNDITYSDGINTSVAEAVDTTSHFMGFGQSLGGQYEQKQLLLSFDWDAGNTIPPTARVTALRLIMYVPSPQVPDRTFNFYIRKASYDTGGPVVADYLSASEYGSATTYSAVNSSTIFNVSSSTAIEIALNATAVADWNAGMVAGTPLQIVLHNQYYATGTAPTASQANTINLSLEAATYGSNVVKMEIDYVHSSSALFLGSTF